MNFDKPSLDSLAQKSVLEKSSIYKYWKTLIYHSIIPHLIFLFVFE